MKSPKPFLKNLRVPLIGSALALSAMVSTPAAACDDLFYVIWVEAEGGTNVYVRHVTVDSTGTTDRYGIMDVPDDTAFGINPNYIHHLLVQAYVDNTKLRIFTDDIDCEISSNSEILGTITEVEAADLF